MSIPNTTPPLPSYGNKTTDASTAGHASIDGLDSVSSTSNGTIGKAGEHDEAFLEKVMSDHSQSSSEPLSLQQYPSPDPAPNPYVQVGAQMKSPYRMQPGTTVGDLIADNDGLDSWHSAEDDSSGPALSTPSPQLQASDASSENEYISLEYHGPIKTPIEARDNRKETILKLSPAMIHELTSSPESLPLHLLSTKKGSTQASQQILRSNASLCPAERPDQEIQNNTVDRSQKIYTSGTANAISPTGKDSSQSIRTPSLTKGVDHVSRPYGFSRTVSTPPLRRSKSSSKFPSAQLPPSMGSRHSRAVPTPLQFRDHRVEGKASALDGSMPSPMPQSIPLPPLSLPTYLQLELSSHRPSPLYIYRSASSDFPYESSRIKIERLQNFLLLPPQLEQVLWFGALACLDSWLFSFTILPLRFFKALALLAQSWGRNLATEIEFIGIFIHAGAGRMWRRRRQRDSKTTPGTPSAKDTTSTSPITTGVPAKPPEFSFPNHNDNENPSASHSHPQPNHKRSTLHKHRRSKSMPSALLPDHKADILKGLLIIISCTILMYFDASRMYHGIRGQAAIKLYVIYNVLEVCDRLFSALGQDVLECLFSKEALERKPDGRSKILRPFWLFVLALLYNLVHATALFYQVITLNVAVNSYSNALLTLLMSNQFVEIKSTVFKKFEKENLFQLTCADVVERFQLWLMLTIIASRNIIETGGLSLGFSDSGTGAQSASTPVRGPSTLPKSFTLLPDWTGQVMGPFVLVLGSEMLVDWIKHAYITKFNNTKPSIYGRFLDVLAKDYYSNAFADQNLTRRLGLPVIPLSCLFIRASVQTYHMFLATHMPPRQPSTTTSLFVDSATTSPATTAAFQHIDYMVRRALGRSTFGAGDPTLASERSGWNTDDAIAFATMIVFFLLLYLVLLALKLVLGMCLLSFARRRYKGMKERENNSAHAEGKRVGGWGVVEVDEDKRRWIYKDDPDGARRLREREAAINEKGGKEENYGGVSRYSMVAKRIW